MGERVKGRLVDTEFDEIDAEVGAYREANLLVALLLRYPEIGSVRVLPSSASITLSFWLHAEPDPALMEEFRRRLAQSLHLLSRSEGGGLRRQVHLDVKRQGTLSLLRVSRDLETLAAEEFAILLGMVRQYFGNLVVVEGDAVWTDADDEYDADLSIAYGLDQVRSARQGDALIGFRHEGRVLVYSAT